MGPIVAELETVCLKRNTCECGFTHLEWSKIPFNILQIDIGKTFLWPALATWRQKATTAPLWLSIFLLIGQDQKILALFANPRWQVWKWKMNIMEYLKHPPATELRHKIISLRSQWIIFTRCVRTNLFPIFSHWVHTIRLHSQSTYAM